MKISIITACYNRAETIGGAIESVLAQSYGDVELIVVDGASSDGSVAEALRAMGCAGRTLEEMREGVCVRGKWVRLISERDGGMYEAINKGIGMARGDVIGLVHTDDMLYDEEVLTAIADCFVRTEAEMVYGDGVFVKQDDLGRVVRNWVGGRYARRKVRWGWLPLHPTCYIRREVMLREGLYDESYRMAADSDLLVRYLYEAQLRVEYLPRRVIRMRMGGMSTDAKRRKAMWHEDVRMYRSHGFWAVPTKLMKMARKVPQFFS